MASQTQVVATSSRAGPAVGPAPIWGRVKNSDSTKESPWTRKVILCLDGGGVRGYASLLILQEIMKQAKSIEQRQENGDQTHFPSPSSAAYCWFERDARNAGAPGKPWNDGDFLPHHYFDYFVGTSTGGLSAMMLGRLRMDVDEAMRKYSIVGKEVFAHPRLITGRGILHARFKSRYMERSLQSITAPYRENELGPTQRPSGGFNQTQNNASSGQIREPSRRETKRRAEAVKLRNKNVDAARTVVIAYGGRRIKEAVLYRSYDHREPDESSTTTNPQEDEEYKEKHYNHWPASDLPLWEIGRATSAAPTYFSPIEIGDEEIIDGALAGANNPIRFAYDEVMQMHSPHEPALIISIGTGIKSQREDQPRLWTAGIKVLPAERNARRVLGLRRDFQDAVLNSEGPHNDFARTVRDINARLPKSAEPLLYSRFNIPEEFGLGKIKLGDWKGTNGNGRDTLGAIRDAVDTYLRQNEVERKILNCATRMVRIRQQRQQTVRWERYALNSVYCCHVGSCERLFESRLKFRNHAVRAHGLVWSVPSEDHQGTHRHNYTCFWDDCSEIHVTVFDKEADFINHLTEKHHMEKPRVLSRKEFEDWLDQGRKTKVPDPTHRQTTFNSNHRGRTG